ncbi:hypothetical protein G8770_13545 [Aestuariicella hydrocarbonica]|uniref:Uncharacterized protein n=1 Tax=Pseudomaricurvus hydrocarbonicus TaxID=1470433 RepID=A0A9E5JVX5_9GAMM|nr:hypothetical protein [Aestuariicella hydrocarbonica]NHO66568.1 hypothetical protein [Aestuariicella hydrocarbonica]
MGKFRFAGVVGLSLVSPLVLAHSGHGGDVGVQHDMEHSLWLLLAVSAVVVAGGYVINKAPWKGKK